MRRSTRRKLWRKVGKVIPYIFYVFLVVMLFRQCRAYDELCRNLATTEGIIIEAHESERNTGSTVTYLFVANGEVHRNTLGVGRFVPFKSDSFIGKKFPVAYDTLDAANNEMLIVRPQFKKYNVPFPDTLEWAEAYLR